MRAIKLHILIPMLAVMFASGCRTENETAPAALTAAPTSPSTPDPETQPAPDPLTQLSSLLPPPISSPPPVTLPKDDGAHDDQLTEWWQWWSHLTTEDGRQLGVMMDFASQGGATPFIRNWNYALRVTDVTAQTSQSSEVSWNAPITHVENGYALAQSGQWAQGGNGHDRLHAEQGKVVFDLEVIADKPAVMLFNADGVFRADGADVHLYQRQRIQTRGWITENGRKIRVTGTTWFEHGYATMLSLAQANWDYFQMELEDGRNIQLMQLRRFKGGPDMAWQGQITAPDGSVTYLSTNDMNITQTAFWQRDAACRYPIGWQVRVKDEYFNVMAVTQNQEQPNIRLWDGETVISGKTRGIGVAETINYCPAPQLPL